MYNAQRFFIEQKCSQLLPFIAWTYMVGVLIIEKLYDYYTNWTSWLIQTPAHKREWLAGRSEAVETKLSYCAYARVIVVSTVSQLTVKLKGRGGSPEVV